MPGKPPPERQCVHHSKRTGARCEAWAIKGKDSCYHHGGTSRAGIDSPTFKTGRYSKSLPDRLVERYETALNDEERHNLRDEIGLAETKVDDLLSKMDRGESDELWILLRSLEAQMRRTSSDDTRRNLLTELLRLVRQGGAEARSWNDVERWTARKQRLVEADIRVAQMKQEMVSAEEVMALIAGILDAIRRHVEDQTVRSALARDIRALSAGGGDVIPIDRAR